MLEGRKARKVRTPETQKAGQFKGGKANTTESREVGSCKSGKGNARKSSLVMFFETNVLEDFPGPKKVSPESFVECVRDMSKIQYDSIDPL